jgi:prepilin-type N-terminal cleavage/methylation domain-containing protein
MNRSNSSQRVHAFTLVELLVVIGIIAVLVGILFPALNRARSAAYSVNCLSNLRDCGNMLQMYAAAYKDKVPLGYLQNRRFESYTISHPTIGANGGRDYPVLGPMYVANFMGDGRSWYCPSPNQVDTRWMYNSRADAENGANPWPPEQAASLVRAGYYFRPLITWYGSHIPPPTVPNEGNRPNPWPLMSKLNKVAIATDLWPIPLGSVSKVPPHPKSVNVLWGDKSASAVPTLEGPIKDKIDFINADVGLGSVTMLRTHWLNNISDPEVTPGLWDLYDRLKR